MSHESNEDLKRFKKKKSNKFSSNKHLSKIDWSKLIGFHELIEKKKFTKKN